MRRILVPLIFGLVGCAILMSLGFWQLRRLDWKQAMLAQIEARIHDAPITLPATADESAKYTPVTVTGMTGEELLVLSGQKGIGAGYEVITAFTTDDGRRLLLDRGFFAEPQGQQGWQVRHPPTRLTVQGNLHWPQETSPSTPPADATRNLWFARDVPAMAQALNTEPLLVVAARIEGDTQGVTPQPIAITGIPNDHLGYAIQWFAMAAVWAGMTAFLIWRITRRTT